MLEPMRALSWVCLALVTCATTACGGQAKLAGIRPAAAARTASKPAPKTVAEQLNAAQRLFDDSEYRKAEAGWLSVSQSENAPPDAVEQCRLGLARTYLITGRYAEAERSASELFKNGKPPHTAEAAWIVARAQVSTGQLAVAEAWLRAVIETDRSPRLRLELGEVLLELGRRDEAEAVLMTIVEDYNNDVITEKDGRGLSVVGRAAHLLRSPEDANDAFNQAEQVLESDPETLLWRAELYLEKFDSGHAEEVTAELLKRSPNHPDALAMMAEVRLAQALDFKEARRLIKQAQAVNPRSAKAFYVLAGLALRDMGLAEAAKWVKEGLKTNPRDLPLLSMGAAERFLADDKSGFEAARDRVLRLNPQYSRLYQIVGEYAEWEHRYEEIVLMMREAVLIDNDDARAHAQLGLNAIRSGDDQGGLQSLRTAFAKDPFNVRVFNTLNLYEKVIAKSYSDVKGELFNFRYPSLERPVLERYVPQLIDQAWNKMRSYYEFTPETPVGIELYAERENFAIRTSGLPQTAIQGVCFGKTLASMSPRHEEFNLGMTLWHELAHVFHIQLSKNHVPRWFTEGLAEYETLVERVEWKRERDAELFDALRENRLPKIGAMNESFTHAEDLGDVTVAYYASTQIVKMLAEQYGRPKLREMLVLWGAGKSTEEVLVTALGASSAQLDEEFSDYLSRSLARFTTQFVPRQRVGNPEQVAREAKARPKDPDAVSRLALLLMTEENTNASKHAVGKALALDSKHANALWLKARLALREKDHATARATAKQLVTLGRDGYETQLVLAKAAFLVDDDAGQAQALTRASQFDATRSDAPYGLLQLARKRGDTAGVEKWLRALHDLEEHNGEIYTDLTKQLVDAGRPSEAIEVGVSAVYAATESVSAHLAYASALAAAGQLKEAEYEYLSATLCPAESPELARAHVLFSQFLAKQGDNRRAAKELDKAKRLGQRPGSQE